MVFELYSEHILNLFKLWFGAVWRHKVKFRVRSREKGEEKVICGQ